MTGRSAIPSIAKRREIHAHTLLLAAALLFRFTIVPHARAEDDAMTAIIKSVCSKGYHLIYHMYFARAVGHCGGERGLIGAVEKPDNDWLNGSDAEAECL